MSRFVIAALIAVWACRARVAIAPGVSAPLPAVLLALVLAAAALATVLAIRVIRRGGWGSRPCSCAGRAAYWRA